MSEKDYLVELLNQADQHFGVEARADAVQLTEDVWGMYRQRRRRRKTALGAFLILLAAGLGWFGIWSGGVNEQKQQVAAQQEYEAFSRQAQQTLAQIRELNAQSKQSKSKRQLYREYARLTVQSETILNSEDKAALKLMHFADGLGDKDDGRDAKIRTYDRVIQYFPNSKYAETAKEKLAALRSSI